MRCSAGCSWVRLVELRASVAGGRGRGRGVAAAGVRRANCDVAFVEGGRRRMVPVRRRRDQTRRAGRRLGTAGTGRSGRPAGVLIRLRSLAAVEAGRGPRRVLRWRSSSAAAAACRALARSRSSSSTVRSSGPPAAGCCSAAGSPSIPRRLLVGRRGGRLGGARVPWSRPGSRAAVCWRHCACAHRMQDGEPAQDGEHTTWSPAAVNNPVCGRAAPQRFCAGRAAQVQGKAGFHAHGAAVAFRRRFLRSRALGGHNAWLVVTV